MSGKQPRFDDTERDAPLHIHVGIDRNVDFKSMACEADFELKPQSYAAAVHDTAPEAIRSRVFEELRQVGW